MKENLLEILCCPECKQSGFKLNNFKKVNDEIEKGILCCACGNTYSIINGIPRFTEYHKASNYDKDTKEKFEFQWKKWGKDSIIFGKSKSDCFRFFSEFSGSTINEKSLNGKLVLDAGCGHGRFVEIFAEFGAESVGLDFGDGVEIARWRTKHLQKANIIQANILRLPFKEKIFDYVWSLGVIHHTPDPRLAFKSLAGIVKTGGHLDIWVYPKESIAWEISQKSIRAITTRLPPQLLYYLCYLAVPLLSVVSTYSKTRFPKNSWRQCAQVIYDWYSPPYQTHHTTEEIRQWYREEGFDSIETLKTAVSLSGSKKC